MSPEIIVVISLLAFFILIAAEMPIAIAIAAAGIFGIVLLGGTEAAASVVASAPYGATAKYALLVIPMYILLGSLISNAGIGARIFSAVNRVVHRLPGGLAATSVLATAIFSGISGSSAADVATFGKISVQEMGRSGYRRPYAAAVVAAAGAFAALIPPSVTIILYAILAEESIGAMILAGVIPGIASALILAGFVIAIGLSERSRARKADADQVLVAAAETADALNRAASESRPSKGTRSSTPAFAPVGLTKVGLRASSWRADILALFYAFVLFLIVVGGLYGGVFTATEAGAVGAFCALVIALFVLIARRQKEMSTPRLLWRSVTEASEVTSMIFLLLIGGAIFSFALAYSGVPTNISEWASTLPVPPHMIIAVILLLLLPLGAFLDGLSIMLLTVPVLAPVAVGLGFDGIWFGILILKTIEIGLITPPVGVNVFIISGITGIRAEKVFRALVPFVILDILVTALLFAFPEIILWLPRVAGVL